MRSVPSPARIQLTSTLRRSQHGQGHKPKAFNDLYRFSIDTNSWSQIEPTVNDLPKPRAHFSFLSLSFRALLLYGGARCTPSCVCWGDTWVFDIENARWKALNVSHQPIHRYRQNLVLNQRDGALYLFGGESYQPYMYHNSVDKLVISGEAFSRLLDAPAVNRKTRKTYSWLPFG